MAIEPIMDNYLHTQMENATPKTNNTTDGIPGIFPLVVTAAILLNLLTLVHATNIVDRNASEHHLIGGVILISQYYNTSRVGSNILM